MGSVQGGRVGWRKKEEVGVGKEGGLSSLLSSLSLSRELETRPRARKEGAGGCAGGSLRS
jgi:hypothetical protein